mmetsp:Transcript_27582/g.94182  ORF Transcript_27582/g.94182 Transcript_27582/m.94182 type:complete len:234 (+) Transcript_27582:60-761(+)
MAALRGAAAGRASRVSAVRRAGAAAGRPAVAANPLLAHGPACGCPRCGRSVACRATYDDPDAGKLAEQAESDPREGKTPISEAGNKAREKTEALLKKGAARYNDVATSVNLRAAEIPPSAALPGWQALVEVGGSQRFLEEGRYYDVNNLKGLEPGEKFQLNRVLMTKDKDGKATFGFPYVGNAYVEAQVLEHFKDKKKMVFKFKPKKHYKRTRGHRQAMSRFVVTKVEYGDSA